jgi:hypothetical protein
MERSHDTLAYGTEERSSLARALARIIAIIDEENAVLAAHVVAGHGAFTERKNQSLRELMAAQKSESISEGRQKCAELLQKLESALRENARLLKIHISALGEVSDIIIGSIRDMESDGTYTRRLMPTGG